MKVLMRSSAGLTLILGLTWLLVPQTMLGVWGVHGDALTLYMSRRSGALFCGYAALLWLARDVVPSAARPAILAGGAVATSTLALVSLVGALTGVVGRAIWSAFVIEAVLAGAFIYFLAKDR